MNSFLLTLDNYSVMWLHLCSAAHKGKVAHFILILFDNQLLVPNHQIEQKVKLIIKINDLLFNHFNIYNLLINARA
jgi:hypothetical protein